MIRINGRTAVLIPDHVGLAELRTMAESVGCILKHDDVSGMPEMVPRNQCLRPVEDMKPKVVSIANMQRKEKPETLLARFNKWVHYPGPDHDPDGPRAA